VKRNKLSRKSCAPRVARYATLDKNAPMKIGGVIEACRNDLGWSQDELADKTGTTKSNLSRIEKDKQWPRPELLEAIAAALGLKVYQIFAAAEGIELPIAPQKLPRGEDEMLNAYRGMDNNARLHFKAIALMLAAKR